MALLDPTASPELLFHAATALVLSLVIASSTRSYRKEYLNQWSHTFALLAAMFFLLWQFDSARSGFSRALIALLLGTALGAAVWSIVSGSYTMALRRQLPGSISRGLLITSLAVGGVGGIGLEAALPGTVRTHPVAVNVVSGIVLLGGGLVVLWERRKRLAPGFLYFAAGVAVAGASAIMRGILLAGGIHLPSLEAFFLLALVLAGCSVLLFAADDEREAALVAASQIEQFAYYDPLTGLANRALFLDQLIALTARDVRSGRKAALLFLDLDRLKPINDTLGHNAGDAVIKETATRIRSVIRKSDLAARFAGDEFTVILTDIKQNADAARVAQKLLAALRQPVTYGSSDVSVSASIGITNFPDDGTDPETLIRNADTAMYRAKKMGRDRFEFSSPTINADVVARFEIEQGLRRALAEKSITLLYQPIVRLADRTVTGVEALVRWHDPELGDVSAGDLVAAAEESTLLAPFTDFVIREASVQAAKWGTGFPDSGFVVSINLSPKQFGDIELVDRVRRAIDDSGVDPRMLQLEITETAAMGDVQRSRQVLAELRQLGVRIALDDFGTGYSSLAYLSLLPIDTLKIDRSFLSGTTAAGSNIIFSAAAALGRRLSMHLVAEGIEDEAQVERAISEAVEYGQGFYFSRPVPAEDVGPFAVLAPAERRESQEPLESSPPLSSLALPSPSSARSGPKPTAIVADDDAIIRNLVATLLRRSGFDVLQARTGEEAIELLSGTSPSVFVLDLMMPQMSGWEVLEHVRDRYPHIASRIVVITAAGERHTERIDRSLYGELLEKPFDQSDFYEVIARCSAPITSGEDEGDEQHVN